ncbi:MAG: biotin--[Clostridia bacterium]|nr:biotin--[acetyl-CoA-carboxylase] ligase [Clostridia bacterium]
MINFPLDTVYLESVDSTNSYLKRIIKESGLSKGMAVMAKSQTAGRGRLGRSWLSNPRDTLCMSIGVKNDYAEGFTLLAALAVYEALKPFCSDKNLQIKWPNDIIAENKKLCGILCERVDEYTVIGIGINVNDKSFVSEIEHKATSLYLLSGKENDVSDIFKAVNSAFENVLTKYDFAFSKDAKEAYTKLCANLGKSVATETKSGVAVGIGDDGSLQIKSGDEVFNVSSGEVAVHNIY